VNALLDDNARVGHNVFIALAIKTYIPLLLWGFIVSALYLDVLREYWNPRVLHITFLYSAVALAWRIARSTVLLVPTKVFARCRLYESLF
jgi:hypothetical protein